MKRSRISSAVIGSIAATYFKAASPSLDPFHAYVDVLMNLTGASGSTSFVDVKGHPVTIKGSPYIGLDGGTYPAGAMTKTSSNDYLLLTGLAPFGTGDFCIECFVDQRRTLSADPGVLQISTNPLGLNPGYIGNLQILASAASGSKWLAILGDAGGTNLQAAVTSGMVLLCLERVAGVAYFSVNGVIKASVADTTNYAATNLALGGYYATAYGGEGFWQGFRSTVGVNRYGGVGFTPPAFPFII